MTAGLPQGSLASIREPELQGECISASSSSMRSTPPGAGAPGNLRQGPQRSVDRGRVRKQVGNFGVKDNHV